MEGRAFDFEHLGANPADKVEQGLERGIVVQIDVALPAAVIRLLDGVGQGVQPIDFLFHLLQMVHKPGLHHDRRP
jgi:hypothetical protein